MDKIEEIVGNPFLRSWKGSNGFDAPDLMEEAAAAGHGHGTVERRELEDDTVQGSHAS